MYSRNKEYVKALDYCQKAIDRKRSVSKGMGTHTLALSLIAYVNISLYQKRDQGVELEPCTLEYAKEAKDITVCLFGKSSPRSIDAYKTQIAAEYFGPEPEKTINMALDTIEYVLNEIPSLPPEEKRKFQEIHKLTVQKKLKVDNII